MGQGYWKISPCCLLCIHYRERRRFLVPPLQRVKWTPAQTLSCSFNFWPKINGLFSKIYDGGFLWFLLPPAWCEHIQTSKMTVVAQSRLEWRRVRVSEWGKTVGIRVIRWDQIKRWRGKDCVHAWDMGIINGNIQIWLWLIKYIGGKKDYKPYACSLFQQKLYSLIKFICSFYYCVIYKVILIKSPRWDRFFWIASWYRINNESRIKVCEKINYLKSANSAVILPCKPKDTNFRSVNCSNPSWWAKVVRHTDGCVRKWWTYIGVLKIHYLHEKKNRGWVLIRGLLSAIA